MTQVLHLPLDFPCLELLCGSVIGHPLQRELVTGQEQVDDELHEKVPTKPRGSSPFGAAHTQHTCGIKNTWNLQFAMPVWERVVLDLVACEPRFFTDYLLEQHLPGRSVFLLLLFNCMCERGF